MPIVRATDTLGARLSRWFAPLEAPGSLPAGFRLASWDGEQGLTLQFSGPGSRLEIEVERADPDRPCFARTREFNVYYDLAGGASPTLSDAEREVLASVVALLRAREDEVSAPVLDPAGRRVFVRELEVRRALVPDGPDAYYFNPYVGCMLACPFCYASHRGAFSRSLDGQPEAEWGKWVDVKLNAPEIVAEEVRRLTPGVVRISPIITDPYQPLERRYRITRKCLAALVGTDFVPVVLTRSSLVMEDVPLLARCTRGTLGMSICTDDDAIRARFEPATDSIPARVDALRAAKAAGLRTFAVVQPMLPMDPAALATLLAPVVEAVRIGPRFERARVLPIYGDIGRLDAADEPWERQTFATLSRELTARGVAVNPTTPEWSFLK